MDPPSEPPFAAQEELETGAKEASPADLVEQARLAVVEAQRSDVADNPEVPEGDAQEQAVTVVLDEDSYR